LEILPKIISDIDDAEFVVAGEVRDKELLNQILKIQNVKYAGLLSPQAALDLEANSDIIIALYDPSVTINNYAKPNKLFESMLCGVPIITNISNNIVNEISNGIIVEYDNKKQIRDAIVRLMNDSDLHRTLGNNGRYAFLKKYNWTLMEQKLFDAYKFLLNK
jgi:glycosyltransferase involved in cell wall biosynthesis